MRFDFAARRGCPEQQYRIGFARLPIGSFPGTQNFCTKLPLLGRNIASMGAGVLGPAKAANVHYLNTPYPVTGLWLTRFQEQPTHVEPSYPS